MPSSGGCSVVIGQERFIGAGLFKTCQNEQPCPDHPRNDGATMNPIQRPGGTMPDYPLETLDEDDDNGTMPGNVAALGEAVIGHRIISAERTEVPGRYYGEETALVLTLDSGKRVVLADNGDCCAYTSLNAFLLHPESVDHMILGVGTTDGYTTWHIFADFGDVMKLTVGWSCGNPFYYSYGFDIRVEDVGEV